MRRTVLVETIDSTFIKSVSHDGRGILRVEMRNGNVYRYRAPISIADIVKSLSENECSVGRFYNAGVRGVFERV